MSFDEMFDLARACLLANGCDEANACAIAETVTAAECDDCRGHGLIRIPGYVSGLRNGAVDGRAVPSISKLAPAVVRVDAQGGFAPLALKHNHETLVELARKQGLAVAAIVRVHHFSALWMEVESLARAGLCAFACTTALPAIPPAGGRTPLFGTNPVAFGWPRKDQSPMVFDLATASRAKGEIMIALREGKKVPDGTGLDGEGRPTNDPEAILHGGALLPFGGYKGANIAMMVELLAAGLIGENFSYEAGHNHGEGNGPPREGEFVLAIDPAKFSDDWEDRGEAFFARLLSIEGARLPSTRRYTARELAFKQGVDVPLELLERILDLTR